MSSAAIRRWTSASVLVGVFTAAAGCGASETTPLSAGRAARWHDTIAKVRASATTDRPAALTALTRLSAYVDRDAKAGQLPVADAAALRAGIAQARRHLPKPAATASVPAPALDASTPRPAVAPATNRPATPSASRQKTSTPQPPRAAGVEQPSAAQTEADRQANAKGHDKRVKTKPEPQKVKPEKAKAPKDTAKLQDANVQGGEG